ncbi:MAG: hypothetical protein H7098_13815, partial [Oligoflexus sp.]|nr:hypothetical protein [Pseudopedobacter sp.]
MPATIVSPLSLTDNKLDSASSKVNYYQVNINPTIKLVFNNSIDRSSVANSINLNENGSTPVS